MFEDLKKLIEETNILEHGCFGDVLKEWIKASEAELGYDFPPSYKWWLEKYGYGFLNKQPIYTIAPPEYKDLADTDIVTAEKIRIMNKTSTSGRLYFYEPSD